MALNFDDFLKPENLSGLEDTIQKMENKYVDSKDERYWKLEVDKAGNGFAVIRFLPAFGEDVPFVKIYDHGFQGPGGWYMEKSLTTIGLSDPLSEYNSSLWNRGDEEGKEQARKQKRRQYFHANIYVVRDPQNPQNEGKVFLFQFGKKIFDKIKDAISPVYEGEERIDVFNPITGADFKLKAKNVAGYRNYDSSEFGRPGPISDSNGNELSRDEAERIWKSTHSVKELISPENFKSYDELKARLDRVLGDDGRTAAPSNSVGDDDGMENYRAPRQAKEPTLNTTPSPLESVSYDDNDDEIDFFKSLELDD